MKKRATYKKNGQLFSQIQVIAQIGNETVVENIDKQNDDIVQVKNKSQQIDLNCDSSQYSSSAFYSINQSNGAEIQNNFVQTQKTQINQLGYIKNTLKDIKDMKQDFQDQSFKNINKRFFRFLIDKLIQNYSDYKINYQIEQKNKTYLKYVDQTSCLLNNINECSFDLIDLFLELKKKQKFGCYSLKHYRILVLQLSEYSLKDLNEEDKQLHNNIFGKLFSEGHIVIINKIKKQISELVNNIIGQIQQLKDYQDSIKDDSNSKIPFTKTQISRINSGINKMQNGIYVQRL
ncbi:hypothetical protein PPERSA_01103 [Pseudocohnilembus persalinus]|uniref:Uncharacterized protein n=1 Tax=Pseudocohnilembus persalinus TaxID=266149 RepID=A0A0V0QUI3_PSEPJ|nr:hypothetical protein PPERSA_01103 [Pseudocohnilembus persalinus]|eukprot:KRX06025.1 hypothetical protein PPERSA_01103 [Pseudocohnilembus persalinus]